jgi:hypothetical protein
LRRSLGASVDLMTQKEGSRNCTHGQARSRRIARQPIPDQSLIGHVALTQTERPNFYPIGLSRTQCRKNAHQSFCLQAGTVPLNKAGGRNRLNHSR